jgi:FdhE protein
MLRDRPWDEIAATFERAHRRQPTLAEFLGFCEKLVKAQHSAPVHAGALGLNETTLRDRSARGEPLLPREEFPFDVASSETLFRNLCGLAKERGSEIRAAAEEIESAIGWKGMDVQDLLRGTVAEEGYPFGMADRWSLDPELLQTLAEASVRPSVQAVAMALGSFVANDRWLRTICPVCGSEPKFAELRGQELGASRYLHCGFCGWAWPIHRLGCPFCDNKDHDRLQTLIIENHLACKLEVCEVCHRYLKLVDSKEFLGLIPEVEVLLTPHLDLAAVERGYH